MDNKVIFLVDCSWCVLFISFLAKSTKSKSRKDIGKPNPIKPFSTLSEDRYEEIKDNESDEKQIIRQFYHEPEAKIEYVSIDTSIDPYAPIVEGNSLISDEDRLQVIDLKTSKSSKMAKEIKRLSE